MAYAPSVDKLMLEHRAEILAIANQHGARSLRIFGSVARGDARPDSDIDLLVELEPGRSLLDLIAIKQDLEDILGRRVDVLTEASLSPYLKQRVLQDAIPL
jgi:predicted nucleotidyltransferase